jgi:hypothetical protein
MGVMKELAYRSRVCVKHGPFYPDRDFFASELFDDCPECEQEACDREDFEANTIRLESVAEELHDYAKSYASAEEVPSISQMLGLLQLCLSVRYAAQNAVKFAVNQLQPMDRTEARYG